MIPDITTLIDDYFQELVYYIKEFEEVEVKIGMVTSLIQCFSW